MKTVNALTLRQSLGRVLDQLARTGEPIIVEKDRRPRAGLITIEQFQERFVEAGAVERRRAIARAIEAQRAGVPHGGKPAVEALRELRGPLL